MYKTINLALSLPSDYAEFAITIPYPGTELYNIALKNGIIPYDYWKNFTKNPTPYFVLPKLIENIVSRKKLLGIHRTALTKFYLRPRYIYAELAKISSFRELWKKTKLGIGLFLSKN